MKTTKTVLAITLALAGIAASGFAFAQHRHGRVAIGIGIGFGVPYAAFPYYYPHYGYYPPYYSPYYPAPVVIQQQAPVYVEQQAQPQQPSGYWYYCNDSRAYYPYVTQCPSGWQRVAPQPG
jgi:hypothetical protein